MAAPIQLSKHHGLGNDFLVCLTEHLPLDANARAKALQGLIVTVGGGLALMTGFILLGHIGGSYELSELITRGDTIVAHPLYELTLVLIVLGAFTKSAQFPFHFWLPNAMAAPTPVSARWRPHSADAPD